MFLAAFAAATLVPAQSEAVLVTLILSPNQPLWRLLIVATVGNVLGSTMNWVMGRFLIRFSGRRWFPASQGQMNRVMGWHAHWGHRSLLAAWVPMIGDPLTPVAGVLREPFWRFAPIVTLAKAGRYLALAWATLTLA